jgi:lambda family phage tail tape measure protein
MAGSLGSLVVSLTAETAQFTAALSKASYNAEKNFKQISSFAKTAAGSLAALYGASSIVGFVKQQIDLADATGKMAQKVGLSVEELSKLQYAAKLADVDATQLQGGLVRLSKGMIEAANGTGQARNAFATMGIAIKNTDGSLKSSGQVLGEVANKFKGYEDSATKTALAVQLFGRAGADLIPLLNSGADGIKEAGDELERFGAVISTNAAKNAELFNDNLTRLSTVGSALGQSIANDILPYLNQLATEFLVAKANGLGFMDMLQMGLRSTNYDEQLKSINKQIEDVNNSWNNPLFGSKDKRLESLERQKKTIIELQTILNKDQLMNPPVPKPEGSSKAPVSIDLAKLEKEAEAYAKGLGRAQDANSKFSNSISEMAARAQQDISGMFMTDAQKKRQADLITINKTFLDTQSEITKQYEEGRLRLKDYNEQIGILAGGYELAVEMANEQYETQERLNGSYEYGAATALSKYIDESRNLANISNGVVSSALSTVEDGLFDIITGSQSAAAAFRNMAISILADIAKLAIKKTVTGFLQPMLGSLVAGGFGGAAGASAGTYGMNTGTFTGANFQLPSFAVGTNYVPQDMVAQIHKGEAIIPAAYNPSAGGAASNNIVVNVNMESGSVSADDGNKLGLMIGNVVKSELIKQKRAGGILA